MKNITQPEGSNLCGQACVATLLQISLEQSIQRVGKKGLTSFKHIREPLKMHFHIWKRKRYTTTRILPIQALITITWGNKKKHWVVKLGSMIYDPAIKYPMLLDDYWGHLMVQRGRITSYIRLEVRATL